MKILAQTLLILVFLVSCTLNNKTTENVNLSPNIVMDLDSGIESMSKQIISTIEKGNKKQIAIIDFSNIDGSTSNLEKYISEELTTKIFITGKFTIIERNLMEKIMNEHKLNVSGIIDQSKAIEIGKVLGVDAICSGSITDFGNRIKLNSRVISTKTGMISSVASVKIEKNDEVIYLMDKKLIKTKVLLEEQNNINKEKNKDTNNIESERKISLNDGLAAYWNFDENLNDSSGNGMDLELMNNQRGNKSTWFEDGHKGNSLKFTEGQSGYLSIPTWKLYKNIKKELTISLWVRHEYEKYEADTVLFSGSFPLNNGFSLVALKNYKGFNFKAIFGNTEKSITEIEISKNYSIWTHIVITVNKKGTKFYINGDLIKDDNQSGDLFLPDNSNFCIGGNYGNQMLDYVYIDEFKIYNRALSQEEVTSLYRN